VQIHANAKLVPAARRVLVRRVLEEDWKVPDVAAAFEVSDRTAYRWLARWRTGDRVLGDRSSAPKRVPRRTPRGLERLIEQLRRLGMTSTRIAATLQMAVSTVGAVLKRLGLNRLSRLGPPEPPNRYERRRPGDLVHLDVKKLARFVRPGHRVTGRDAPGALSKIGHGYEFVHVAVDDYSRIAYVEILDDERKTTAIGFLERLQAWFADRGVNINEILTDNGSCYLARDFGAACAQLGVTHRRTRPRRPQTNGKAERFIQTMLREWAYAAVYRTSHQRALALPPWLDYYNHRRPHGALSHRPPATRLPAA
jgi:transposase InsO family protein